MHRVIVVGSPRTNGRSAALADELFNACIEECPEDGVSIVSVASIEIGFCNGCDACRAATQAPEKLPEDDDNLAVMPLVAQSDALLHRCVIHDDMTEVRKHLDAADELIVVTPVYFASVPAQMKALLDRLQPYFWSNVRRQGKRPMVLHVVGEGGDPHGFEPLIGTVRSAFMCAGFELELVLDWVGKIDAQGEIVAEADEYPIPPMGGFAALGMAADFDMLYEGAELYEDVELYEGAEEDWLDGGPGAWDVEPGDVSQDGFDDEDDWDDFDGESVSAIAETAGGRSRAKLDLSDSSSVKAGKGAQANGKGKSSGRKQGAGAGKSSSAKSSSERSSANKSSAGKSGKASYGKNTPKKGGKRRG